MDTEERERERKLAQTNVSVTNATVGENGYLVGERFAPGVNFHFSDQERTSVRSGKLGLQRPRPIYTVTISTGPYPRDAECVLYLSKNQVRALRAACHNLLNAEE